MSQRVAIYCRDKAAPANRAAVEALRDVASRARWTVVGTFVEGTGPSKPEYDRVWRWINANDIDMVAVPSLAALADGLSGASPRSSGCATPDATYTSSIPT